MRAQGRQCPRSKTKLSGEKQGRIEEDIEEWLRIYQNGKYSSMRLPDVAMLHKLALYLDRAILPKNAVGIMADLRNALAAESRLLVCFPFKLGRLGETKLHSLLSGGASNVAQCVLSTWACSKNTDRQNATPQAEQIQPSMARLLHSWVGCSIRAYAKSLDILHTMLI